MAAVWIRAFGRDAYLAQTHPFATVFVSSCAISFVLPKPMQGLMITRQKWFVSDRRLRWDQRLPTGWPESLRLRYRSNGSLVQLLRLFRG